ncbi:MAG: hypothetical protein ACSHWZ_17585 [Sulfitobacter sp.]
MNEVVNLITLAFAHSATNLDNLALLLVMAPKIGAVRASLAYGASQILVFSAAMLFSWGSSATIGAWAGYLGFIPIMIGFSAIFSGGKPAQKTDIASGASFLLATMTFSGLSVDTLLIFAPLLADGTAVRDYTALGGGVLSVATLLMALMVLNRSTRNWVNLTLKLEKVAPYVMIAAGLFVLLDTPDDLN